jgi:ABC-2 type transport system ATP-binding protein
MCGRWRRASVRVHSESAVIEVSGLVKRYGAHLAVDGVSFSARSGEVLGLLGPNGAGKSTVMRVLAGYLVPTAGHARVAGFDVQASSMEARRNVGYLPESAPLYPEMRVSEYLRYRAVQKGVPGNKVAARLDEAVRACALETVRHRIIGQLSKGYRQRTSLAATLLHDPQVLILDEPTVGLDPLQQRELRSLVRELGKRRTLLFSTHILSDAEAVCDRVLIIDRGRVLADGVPAALAARLSSHTLSLEAFGSSAGIASALKTLPGVHVDVTQEHPTIRAILHTERGDDVRLEVSRAVASAGGLVVELSRARTSLDELFQKVTAQGAPAFGTGASFDDGITLVAPEEGGGEA